MVKKIFYFVAVLGLVFRLEAAPENANQKAFKDATKTEKFVEAHPFKEDDERKPTGNLVNLGDYGVDDFAYLAVPEQEPIGGVLLIHEWWGLNTHMKLTADWYAAHGYVTLAVDLYNGTSTDDASRAGALMRDLNQKLALKVIGAGVRFLKESPRFKVAKVATVGWCMGGGLSLQSALQVDKIDGAVMYYGPVETDRNKLDKLKIPLLGIFGTQDEWVKPESVNEFEKLLIELKKDHQIFRFDAPHAFANPSNAKYKPEFAEQASKAVMAFLYQIFTSPPKKEGFFQKIF
ncbi:MAG: dienelactone hydrolase family protein [Verrucomicrobiota bacterium]